MKEVLHTTTVAGAPYTWWIGSDNITYARNEVTGESDIIGGRPLTCDIDARMAISIIFKLSTYER